MNQTLKNTIRQLLSRSIKPHRILAGPLRGQALVTSWHDYPAAILGRTERPLLDWFTKNVKPGETWLDVGAHYGYTAIALARLVGPTGRVYAFEPMTASAGCIARTKMINKLHQLTVVPFALGRCDNIETRQLPTVRGMVDSTITGEQGEQFLVSTFDWLWPQLTVHQKIDGIKIDVQGMELETLRGMLFTLREQQPKLIVELHVGVSRDEFLDLLESVGYPTGISLEDKKGQIQYADNHSYAFLPAEQEVLVQNWR